MWEAALLAGVTGSLATVGMWRLQRRLWRRMRIAAARRRLYRLTAPRLI